MRLRSGEYDWLTYSFYNLLIPNMVDPERMLTKIWGGGSKDVKIFQLYRGRQFHWWRKPEYQVKTTDSNRMSE